MVVDTSYYDALELAPSATPEEIKKSYRRLARLYHPDKNSSPDAEDKFKVIEEAHGILSDPELRTKYDRVGKEGLKSPGFNNGFPGFNFFNGGGGFPFNFGNSMNPQRNKTENITHSMTVSLEYLYKPTVKKLKISRKVICSDCTGKGGSDLESCTKCHGNKFITLQRMMGPGMIQQQTIACDQCKAKGKIINKICDSCKGDGRVNQSKIIEVQPGRGFSSNGHLVFPGLSDEEPGVKTGDLILKFVQEEHKVFTRVNNNLYTTQTISLNQALTGFKLPIKHLDNKILTLVNKKSTIISPDQEIKVIGKGMPILNSNNSFGDLYIKFKIIFPNSLTDENCEKIREILKVENGENKESNVKDKEKEENKDEETIEI